MAITVNFIPGYNRQAASSRLRVYAIAEALERLGLAEVSIGQGKATGTTGAILVQKVGSPEVFDGVSGHPAVIYDYDDDINSDIFKKAAITARLFTSDTTAHAYLCGHSCEVFPDPIDYAPDAPMSPAEPNMLVWFGNYDNFWGCRELFESARKYARIRTISQIPLTGPMEDIPWSYDSFTRDLRSCGTAFLSHRGLDQGKSANRMIAAVTLGVPCIVNESPAYEALARAVGVDWCIVSNSEELKVAYERLQFPGERSIYLKSIQQYVWEHYHVDVVARRFMEIVRSIL